VKFIARQRKNLWNIKRVAPRQTCPVAPRATKR